MKKKKAPLALLLVIVALILSLYSVYQVSFSNSDKYNEDFSAKVYEVIDAYVAEKSGQTPPSNNPVDVSMDNDAVKGDINAPVTIIEFSDYECPYCGRFFRDTLPQITEKYINTGKVKYVFRDFTLPFHQSAIPASNAAECLREQGGDAMYYEYHDVLFNNQTELSVEKLKGYAADFSINQEEFASCLDSGKYNDEIQADYADGQKAGVQGTPGFFINGYPIKGAQPYSIFEAAIEDALNN